MGASGGCQPRAGDRGHSPDGSREQDWPVANASLVGSDPRPAPPGSVRPSVRARAALAGAPRDRARGLYGCGGSGGGARAGHGQGTGRAAFLGLPQHFCVPGTGAGGSVLQLLWAPSETSETKSASWMLPCPPRPSACGQLWDINVPRITRSGTTTSPGTPGVVPRCPQGHQEWDYDVPEDTRSGTTMSPGSPGGSGYLHNTPSGGWRWPMTSAVGQLAPRGSGFGARGPAAAVWAVPGTRCRRPACGHARGHLGDTLVGPGWSQSPLVLSPVNCSVWGQEP